MSKRKRPEGLGAQGYPRYLVWSDAAAVRNSLVVDKIDEVRWRRKPKEVASPRQRPLLPDLVTSSRSALAESGGR